MLKVSRFFGLALALLIFLTMAPLALAQDPTPTPGGDAAEDVADEAEDTADEAEDATDQTTDVSEDVGDAAEDVGDVTEDVVDETEDAIDATDGATNESDVTGDVQQGGIAGDDTATDAQAPGALPQTGGVNTPGGSILLMAIGGLVLIGGGLGLALTRRK